MALRAHRHKGQRAFGFCRHWNLGNAAWFPRLFSLAFGWCGWPCRRGTTGWPTGPSSARKLPRYSAHSHSPFKFSFFSLAYTETQEAICFSKGISVGALPPPTRANTATNGGAEQSDVAAPGLRLGGMSRAAGTLPAIADCLPPPFLLLFSFSLLSSPPPSTHPSMPLPFPSLLFISFLFFFFPFSLCSPLSRKFFLSFGGASLQQSRQVHPHISPENLTPDVDVPVCPPRTGVNAAFVSGDWVRRSFFLFFRSQDRSRHPHTVSRVATATLGGGAGGGAPFSTLPLHIKNLILPTMSWVNQ